MKTGPKYKIARRLGTPIFEKTQTEKFVLRETRRAKNFKKSTRPRSRTNYGLQLLEKQKARYTYGISERQFSKYVKEALLKKGNPANELYKSLESRLDNIIYRAGFAKTRRMARQLASHGHVTVNGRRSTVPSHFIKEGTVIAIRDGSKAKTPFENILEKQNTNVPRWINVDTKQLKATVGMVPGFDATENVFSLVSVIEFYSR